MITYDVSEIYFSAPGSFLTIKTNDLQNHLVYCTSARQAMSEKWMPYWAANFFEILLIDEDGREVPYSWVAYPHQLDLVASTGQGATFAFADAQTLLFEAHGADVRFVPLKPYKTQYTTHDGGLSLIDTGTQYIHQFSPNADTFLTSPSVGTIEFLRQGTTTSGAFRLIRHEDFWDHKPKLSVTEVAQHYASQFEDWVQSMPAVPEQYRLTAEKALCLLWSCQVPVEGELTRRSIFSSKASMNSIWSWDNCFHALAIAEVDPELAWDQLLLFFDHQAESGILPDSINEGKAIYGYTKPPIYGWTMRKLVDLLGVQTSLPYLAQLYTPLSRLTEWWYRLRGTDSGMCCYHDGNDSGWDNSTVFDAGMPVEGGDLAAYLVIQMEMLAFIADLLGLHNDAQRWQARADDQLHTLFTVGIQDSRFLSRTVDHEHYVSRHSLLNSIPILLGKRVPPHVLSTVKEDLLPEGPYLTAYGLASESLQSPEYTPDGYWRGPVWAPPTYLIVDGLADAGEIDLARLIAQRYCDMLVQDPAFYENYDALTGKGLRCPGICWTAAIFIRLAAWLKQSESPVASILSP